jgi:hypothetical protein
MHHGSHGRVLNGSMLPREISMHSILKPLVIASALCVAALAAVPTQAGVVVGVGIGVPLGYGYYGPGYWAPYGYYPPRVIVAQPAPVAPSPALPDPIFYPNNGQSAAQAESDRRGCNQWAVTQPNAMADASVFQRASYACMEGRGYTVK